MRRCEIVRKLIFWLHLYLGLTLGFLVAIIGLTGSLIVFQPEIDAFLNPDAHRVTKGDARVSPDDAYEMARGAYRFGTVDFAIVRPPHAPDEPYKFLLKEGFAEGDGPFVEVSVDPFTNRVVSARVSEETLTGYLIALHTHLLVGGEHGPMETVVGFGGLAMLIFCVTGLWLWWPGIRRLASGFTVNWGAGAMRANFDLHKVLGFFALIPLLAAALTGLYLVFPNYVRPVYTTFVDAPRPPEAPKSSEPGGRAPIPIAQAIAAAQAVGPDGVVTQAQIALKGRAAYQVRKKTPTDPDQHYSDGKIVVYVDRYSGAVLEVRDARQMPAGQRVLHDWMFPTHTGEIAGLAGRWIMFFAGIAPSVLFGTGLYLWWRKRRLRQLLDEGEDRRRAAESVRA